MTSKQNYLPQPVTHNENDKDEAESFLTLGDGDFSYSLDLVRYLKNSNNHHHQQPLPSSRYRITATGIDSFNELRSKYRDVDSILRKMRNITVASTNENDSGSDSHIIFLAIHHGINAIIKPPPSPTTPDIPFKPHHHVIFNHPHLGTENAPLHSQFLSHLFHSSSHCWLSSPGGLLHVTLAMGQYERWNGGEAAERQGLVLLHRTTFRPPSLGKSPTAFQQRRHQNGKGFANRTAGGSETLTFGRRVDEGKYRSGSGVLSLPWLREDESKNSSSSSSSPVVVASSLPSSPFTCSLCQKTFRDERARKNHVFSVHRNDDSNNNGDNDNGSKRRKKTKNVFICQYCPMTMVNGEGDIIPLRQREFVSKEALHNHINAKHVMRADSMKPDWYRCNKDNNNFKIEELSNRIKKCCKVCGAPLTGGGTDEEMEERHWQMFIPIDGDATTSTTKMNKPTMTFGCEDCGKVFRERRALVQHVAAVHSSITMSA